MAPSSVGAAAVAWGHDVAGVGGMLFQDARKPQPNVRKLAVREVARLHGWTDEDISWVEKLPEDKASFLVATSTPVALALTILARAKGRLRSHYVVDSEGRTRGQPEVNVGRSELRHPRAQVVEQSEAPLGSITPRAICLAC